VSGYEAILFDFDGVLADTEPLHHAAWAQALAPHGLELDWPTYREHCVGFSDRDLVRFVAARAGRETDFERLWAAYPRKQEIFRRRILAEPPISAEVIELLGALDGFKLGLVSSTSRTELEPVLRQVGILERFQTVICADDVTHPKPEPEPYLLAAERLGVKRALVVEDSQAGLASGRAAGFEVLYIPDPRLMPELLRERLRTGLPPGSGRAKARPAGWKA
jgi:HAD superfamily hydrolase (TIGR01509 family)